MQIYCPNNLDYWNKINNRRQTLNCKSMEPKEEPKIISVRELLSNSEIEIPTYQRPYKWGIEHVNMLIDDIRENSHKSEYRLGTLVLHESGNETANNNTSDNENNTADKFENDTKNILNIVDGQQRTITLTLIAHALKQQFLSEENETKFHELKQLNLGLESKEFINDISIRNIQLNYKAIQRRVADFDEKLISFFLEKCTLVQVKLQNLSEAFQYFDSHNSRGKDLEPHNLLKAYHLRAMNQSSEAQQINAIKKWDQTDSATLSRLFSRYLYPIRKWSKGELAMYFSKDDIGEFKGISLYSEQYPYLKSSEVIDVFVKEYNNSMERRVDMQHFTFPFQIDGLIINGERFFEMIEYYLEFTEKIHSDKEIIEHPSIEVIDGYEGQYRIGDQYVRKLFDCALLYYLDKFGKKELKNVINVLFIWAYILRLKNGALRLQTVSNYAFNNENHAVFKIIKGSYNPYEIVNLTLNTLKKDDLKISKVGGLIEKFQELNYYHDE